MQLLLTPDMPPESNAQTLTDTVALPRPESDAWGTRTVQRSSAFKRLSEEQSRLLNAIGYGILSIDSDGTVSFANQHARTLLRREEGICGRDWRHSFSSAPQEELEHVVAASNGAPATMQVMRADRTCFPAEVTVNLTTDIDGPAKRVCVFQDISKRRRALKRVNGAEHVVMLQGIVDGLANQIRQPMTAIHANAELMTMYLQSGANDPKATQTYLDQILEEVTRAVGIVGHMTELVNGGRGIPEPFDLSKAAAGVMTLMSTSLMRDRVQCSFAPYPPAIAFADRLQVEQILINLVETSRRSTVARDAEHGWVGISIKEDADEGVWILEVCDNGCGLPSNPDRIFDPLSTTVESPATVGLSLCRQLASRWGGSLKAENRIDGGACFSLRVPTKPPMAFATSR